MKKILLLLAASFVFFMAQAGRGLTTQAEADSIILERLCQETRPYTIYAKDEVQQKWTITSIDGEVLEVNYFFWIYYIEYADNAGRYILVKESNGNLLEINMKDNNTKPNNLEEWRRVMKNNSECNVDNPLTDLPWLKEVVDYHENNPLNMWIRIFQCTYKDGIGFHVDYHGGAMSPFYSCNGEVICTLGHGFVEDSTCPELNIDFENRKLILEINRPEP